jgi:tetratricopeptide (TPR) repeat protein
MPHDRYPGPSPFEDTPEDRSVFFGRDDEVRALAQETIASRLIVFFGKSGLGKTSLMRAGLFLELRTAGLLPIRVRLSSSASPIELIADSARKASAEWPDFQVDYVPGETGSAWVFFKTAMFWREDRLLTPVLVFDQFEEIFTLIDPEWRRVFAAEIGPLVSGNPPDSVRLRAKDGSAAPLGDAPPKVKVIFSLREEYLGSLQELGTEIPGLFRNRFRLLPLSEKQGREAIARPANKPGAFGTPPFEYQDGTLNRMLDYLKGRSGYIEPFQLQLLCRHVEQKVVKPLLAGATDPQIEITPDNLGDRPAMDAVLLGFYQDSMAQLPRHERRRAQALCDTGLLLPAGNRTSLQKDQIHRDYGIAEETLTYLVDKRILREEPRLEGTSYEISHDTLAQAILKTRPWRVPTKYKIAGGVFASALVVFAVYTYWLLQATNKAHQARDSSDELVGFLIGEDLMEKIRPLGQLGILQQVQGEVDRYLNSLPSGANTELSMVNQGLADLNKGNLAYQRYNLKEAGAKYLAAWDIFNELRRRDPQNLEWLRDLADATVKKASVAEDRLQLGEALKLYESAAEILEKLAETPNRVHDRDRLLRSLAEVYSNIGVIYLKQDHLRKALDYFNKTIKLASENMAPAGGAKWLYLLHEAYLGTGDVLFNEGDYRESERAYQQALECANDATGRSPFEPEAHFRVGLAIEKMAGLKPLHFKPGEALPQYEKLNKSIENLTKWDPNNRRWQRVFAATRILLGDGHAYREENELALKNYREGLLLLEELARVDDSNASVIFDAMKAHQHVGDALAAGGRNEDAIFEYDRALSGLEQLQKQKIDATNTDVADVLVSVHLSKARALSAGKQGASVGLGLPHLAQLVEDHSNRSVTNRMGWLAQDSVGAGRQASPPVSAAAANPRPRDIFIGTQPSGVTARPDGDVPYEAARSSCDRALTALRKAVDPQDAEYRVNTVAPVYSELGDVLVGTGQYESGMAAYARAENALREGIKLGDKNSLYLLQLYLLLKDVAEAKKKKGDKAGALEARRQSVAATEKARTLDPGSTVCQQTVGLAEYTLGILLGDEGKDDEAIAAYKKSEQGWRQAIALEPKKEKKADQWTRIWLALDSEAKIEQNQADKAGALESYREGAVAMEQAVEMQSKDSLHVASLGLARQRFGDALRDNGDLVGAANAYTKAEEALREGIVLKNADASTLLVILLCDHVAPLEIKRGDKPGALNTYHAAIAVAASIDTSGPNGAKLHSDVASDMERIGDSLRDQDEIAEGLAAYARAEQELQQAVRLDEKNARYREAQFQLYVGHVAKAKKDKAGELEAYRHGLASVEQAARLDPLNADYQSKIGLAQERMGDNLKDQHATADALVAYARAENAYRQAVKLDPKTEKYWQVLFKVFYERIAPARAENRDKVGELAAYRDALGVLETARPLIRGKPDYPDYLYTIGVTYEKIGNSLKNQDELRQALGAYSNAEEALRQSVQLNEKDVSHWLQLCLLYQTEVAPTTEALKDQDGALKAYRNELVAIRHVVALESREPIYYHVLGLAHYRIGRIYLDRAKPDQALGSYREAEQAVRRTIDLKKDEADYQNDLAALLCMNTAPLLAQQGDGAGAMREYRNGFVAAENAIALDATKPQYHFHAGVAQEAIGDGLRAGGEDTQALAAYAQAEQALRQAVKLQADGASYWYELYSVLVKAALVHERHRDQAHAIEFYTKAQDAINRAVALEPKDDDYRASRSQIDAKLRALRPQ